MSLGDVLPGVQQGTIDGAISGITVFNAMHFQDAANTSPRSISLPSS